jgi:hypothetical protein
MGRKYFSAAACCRTDGISMEYDPSFSCKFGNLLQGLDNSGFSSEPEIHGDLTFILCPEL